VIPWYRAPEPPPAAPPHGETLGAGQRFAYASLGERGSAGGSSRGGIYWVATVPGARRPEPPAGQLALLRRWFAGWHAPISDLLAATEPDDLVQEPVRDLRPLPPVFAYPAGIGGYVLLGDAAHALTTHLGQGPGLALEDAATLQAVLRGAIPGRSLVDSLEEYNRQRHPRAERVTSLARRLDAAIQSRGVAARFAPRLLERSTAAAADWHPGA